MKARLGSSAIGIQSILDELTSVSISSLLNGLISCGRAIGVPQGSGERWKMIVAAACRDGVSSNGRRGPCQGELTTAIVACRFERTSKRRASRTRAENKRES